MFVLNVVTNVGESKLSFCLVEPLRPRIIQKVLFPFTTACVGLMKICLSIGI